MKKVGTRWVVLVSVAVLSSLAAHAQNELDEKIDSNIADGIGTYRHIHEHPALPLRKETSALVAERLRKLGYDLTDHFGNTKRRTSLRMEWSRR